MRLHAVAGAGNETHRAPTLPHAPMRCESTETSAEGAEISTPSSGSRCSSLTSSSRLYAFITGRGFPTASSRIAPEILWRETRLRVSVQRHRRLDMHINNRNAGKRTLRIKDCAER